MGLSSYTKVKVIGQGSFGKAFLVTRKQDDKKLVMKEIDIRNMKSKEREETRKEVQLLSRLHHPYVVKYIDSFEENGVMYLIMEYCEGGDLFKVVQKQRGIPLSEEQILDWFVQLCLSLKHIHDRKILHRDIKSSNIFIKNGSVKLGDFGIARVLNNTMELARTCIGTPYYLSPEICENRPYNNKSDVWAMGCVLYELCTLKHAFEAGNMRNLVLKIIQGQYPPIPVRYSYELRNLVAAMFKRNPQDRPAVNTILKKPFLAKRVAKWLSAEQYQAEFNHTVLHKENILRANPSPLPSTKEEPEKPSRPTSAASKRPSPAPSKYDPASIYGVPLARPKSAVRRSAEKRERELLLANKRKIEEKQRAMLKEIEEKKISVAERQKKLDEKLKMNKLNKAREDAWKSLISKNPEPPAKVKVPGDPIYNDYLEQIRKRCDPEGISNNEDISRRVRHRPEDAVVPALAQKPQDKAKDERAAQVQNFLDQRRKYQENRDKMRNVSPQMYHLQLNQDKQRNTPAAFNVKGVNVKNRPSSQDAVKKEEAAIMQRLELVRQNNRVRAAPMLTIEERKKKMADLRVRAEANVAQSRQAFDAQYRKAVKAIDDADVNAVKDLPDNVPSPRYLVQKPAVGLTAALGNVRNEKPTSVVPVPKLTDVFKQLSADVPKEAKETPQIPRVQQEKSEILRRLNDKMMPQRDNDESPRGKWNEPKNQLHFSKMPIAQPPDETSAASVSPSVRAAWSPNDQLHFSKMAIQSDDSVASTDNVDEDINARPAWKKGPSETLMNIIQQKTIRPDGTFVYQSKPIDEDASHTADIDQSSAVEENNTLFTNATRRENTKNTTKATNLVLESIDDVEQEPIEEAQSKSAAISQDADECVSANDEVPEGNYKEVEDEPAADDGPLMSTMMGSFLVTGMLAGLFDSPDLKTLRTTSEPNLLTIKDEDCNVSKRLSFDFDVVEEKSEDCINNSKKSCSSSSEEENVEKCPLKTEESVDANDANELSKSDSDEVDYPSINSDSDEDMKSVCASMALFLTKDEKSEEEDETDSKTPIEINEAWDSDEGSISDDELSPKKLTRITEKNESVFFQLERRRSELEDELGSEKFILIYHQIEEMNEREDDIMKEDEKIIEEMLGPSKKHLYPKILQLVLADSIYQEGNC